MDITLIYALKTLLLPGSSLLLLGFVGCAILAKHKKTGMTFLLAALIGLYVLSMPVTANWLAGQLEPAFPVLNTKSAQAIVVLGSGLRRHAVEYGDTVTVSNRTLERVRFAAALHRQTGLPVLVSGGRVLDQSLPSEAEAMAKALQEEFNVPVRWQEGRSRNTAENALYSSEILNTEHISNILLVTHAFHMQRALIEFKRRGIKAQPASTAYLYEQTDEVSLLDFIPSPVALLTSNLVLHEYLGMLWYHYRYS